RYSGNLPRTASRFRTRGATCASSALFPSKRPHGWNRHLRNRGPPPCPEGWTPPYHRKRSSRTMGYTSLPRTAPPSRPRMSFDGQSMNYDFLSLAAHGIFPLPWWGYVAITLILTHVTIAAVTIFLHRCQAHRGLDLHPVVSHFFRFWLWLTTGMVTKEWVAIHRKHHAKVETDEDPHSPQTRGIGK